MSGRAIAAEHILSPRELRLRERIDQLLDHRSQLQAVIEHLEAEVDNLNILYHRVAAGKHKLEKSRDHWKHQATARKQQHDRNQDASLKASRDMWKARALNPSIAAAKRTLHNHANGHDHEAHLAKRRAHHHAKQEAA